MRIGNGAYDQDQHDVWGAVLDSVYLHTKSRDFLPERVWPILEKQVEAAIENWRDPDRGIWEVRGEPQHFTSSKLMCWVACDRGARLAELKDDSERAERWQAEADAIHEDICEHGIDSRGVFCQHYDTDGARRLGAADAARPLPPRRATSGFTKTVLAIADELTQDGLVLRYRVEETDDGLSGEEGTFTICSFWLVSALVEIGEVERGRAALRATALARQPAAALRRGARRQERPPSRQLPAGVHAPRPDQRGDARDPRRAGLPTDDFSLPAFSRGLS